MLPVGIDLLFLAPRHAGFTPDLYCTTSTFRFHDSAQPDTDSPYMSHGNTPELHEIDYVFNASDTITKRTCNVATDASKLLL